MKELENKVSELNALMQSWFVSSEQIVPSNLFRAQSVDTNNMLLNYVKANYIEAPSLNINTIFRINISPNIISHIYDSHLFNPIVSNAVVNNTTIVNLKLNNLDVNTLLLNYLTNSYLNNITARGDISLAEPLYAEELNVPNLKVINVVTNTLDTVNIQIDNFKLNECAEISIEFPIVVDNVKNINISGDFTYNSVNIGNLYGNIKADSIKFNEIIANDLIVDSLDTNKINTNDVVGSNINADKVIAGDFNSESLNGNQLITHTLNSNINTNTLTTLESNIGNLEGNDLTLNKGYINNGVISNINTPYIESNLEFNNGNINNMTLDLAVINSLHLEDTESLKNTSMNLDSYDPLNLIANTYHGQNVIINNLYYNLPNTETLSVNNILVEEIQLNNLITTDVSNAKLSVNGLIQIGGDVYTNELQLDSLYGNAHINETFINNINVNIMLRGNDFNINDLHTVRLNTNNLYLNELTNNSISISDKENNYKDINTLIPNNMNGRIFEVNDSVITRSLYVNSSTNFNELNVVHNANGRDSFSIDNLQCGNLLIKNLIVYTGTDLSWLNSEFTKANVIEANSINYTIYPDVNVDVLNVNNLARANIDTNNLEIRAINQLNSGRIDANTLNAINTQIYELIQPNKSFDVLPNGLSLEGVTNANIVNLNSDVLNSQYININNVNTNEVNAVIINPRNLTTEEVIYKAIELSSRHVHEFGNAILNEVDINTISYVNGWLDGANIDYVSIDNSIVNQLISNAIISKEINTNTLQSNNVVINNISGEEVNITQTISQSITTNSLYVNDINNTSIMTMIKANYIDTDVLDKSLMKGGTNDHVNNLFVNNMDVGNSLRVSNMSLIELNGPTPYRNSNSINTEILNTNLTSITNLSVNHITTDNLIGGIDCNKVGYINANEGNLVGKVNITNLTTTNLEISGILNVNNQIIISSLSDGNIDHPIVIKNNTFEVQTEILNDNDLIDCGNAYNILNNWNANMEEFANNSFNDRYSNDWLDNANNNLNNIIDVMGGTANITTIANTEFNKDYVYDAANPIKYFDVAFMNATMTNATILQEVELSNNARMIYYKANNSTLQNRFYKDGVVKVLTIPTKTWRMKGMEWLFNRATNDYYKDLIGINNYIPLDCTNMWRAFQGCFNLNTPINFWSDTIEEFAFAFMDARNIPSANITLDSINGNQISTRYMFRNARNVTDINVYGNTPGINAENMFSLCPNLKNVYVEMPIGGSINRIFDGSPNLQYLNIKWGDITYATNIIRNLKDLRECDTNLQGNFNTLWRIWEHIIFNDTNNIWDFNLDMSKSTGNLTQYGIFMSNTTHVNEVTISNINPELWYMQQFFSQVNLINSLVFNNCNWRVNNVNNNHNQWCYEYQSNFSSLTVKDCNVYSNKESYTNVNYAGRNLVTGPVNKYQMPFISFKNVTDEIIDNMAGPNSVVDLSTLGKNVNVSFENAPFLPLNNIPEGSKLIPADLLLPNAKVQNITYKNMYINGFSSNIIIHDTYTLDKDISRGSLEVANNVSISMNWKKQPALVNVLINLLPSTNINTIVNNESLHNLNVTYYNINEDNNVFTSICDITRFTDDGWYSASAIVLGDPTYPNVIYNELNGVMWIPFEYNRFNSAANSNTGRPFDTYDRLVTHDAAYGVYLVNCLNNLNYNVFNWNKSNDDVPAIVGSAINTYINIDNANSVNRLIYTLPNFKGEVYNRDDRWVTMGRNNDGWLIYKPNRNDYNNFINSNVIQNVEIRLNVNYISKVKSYYYNPKESYTYILEEDDLNNLNLNPYNNNIFEQNYSTLWFTTDTSSEPTWRYKNSSIIKGNLRIGNSCKYLGPIFTYFDKDVSRYNFTALEGWNSGGYERDKYSGVPRLNALGLSAMNIYFEYDNDDPIPDIGYLIFGYKQQVGSVYVNGMWQPGINNKIGQYKLGPFASFSHSLNIYLKQTWNNKDNFIGKLKDGWLPVPYWNSSYANANDTECNYHNINITSAYYNTNFIYY